MMDIAAAMAGSVGSVALFGFLTFAVWIDYRKKKDERDAAHQERMKALELGHPPLDAEVERARAYGKAAWAAGLIGLLIPLAVVALAVIGTIVAVIHRPGEAIAGALIVAWSIAAAICLVTIVLSLHTIRQLPRPAGETPPPRVAGPGRRGDRSSEEYQEKHLEL
jgi:hypothetical protein